MDGRVADGQFIRKNVIDSIFQYVDIDNYEL